MVRFKLAAVAAALLMSSSAQAVTYDAFASFNATQGAGGFTWVSASPTGTTPLTGTPCTITNTICLGLDGAPFNLPGVFKSTGIPSTSHPYQPLDRLLVHPGSASSLIGFFNAPTDGEYSFTATLDALTSSTSVAIFAITNAGGAVSTIGTGFLATEGQTRTFGGTYQLSAGQFFGIGVNNSGNFAGDSTGLRFSVTSASPAAVPEPATWAMMLVGFGAIGFAMRRKRQQQPKVRFAF